SVRHRSRDNWTSDSRRPDQPCPRAHDVEHSTLNVECRGKPSKASLAFGLEGGHEWPRLVILAAFCWCLWTRCDLGAVIARSSLHNDKRPAAIAASLCSSDNTLGEVCLYRADRFRRSAGWLTSDCHRDRHGRRRDR